MCESVAMPFVYRLQKILDFRIRKKEEQLLVVQKAKQELLIAEQNILANNNEIELIKQNQRQAFSILCPYQLKSFIYCLNLLKYQKLKVHMYFQQPLLT